MTGLWLCFPELFLLLTKPWAGGNELRSSVLPVVTCQARGARPGGLQGLPGLCQPHHAPLCCASVPGLARGRGQPPHIPRGAVPAQLPQLLSHSPESPFPDSVSSPGLQQPPQKHSRACLHPPRGCSHSQTTSQGSTLLFPELLSVFQSNSTESLG